MMDRRAIAAVLVTVCGFGMVEPQPISRDPCPPGSSPISPLRVCPVERVMFFFLIRDTCGRGAFCQAPRPLDRGPGICCTRPSRPAVPQITCPAGSVPSTRNTMCGQRRSFFTRRPQCGRGFCWQPTPEEAGICCMYDFSRTARRQRRVEWKCPSNPQTSPCDIELEATCGRSTCPRGQLCCPYGCGMTCMRAVRGVSSAETTPAETVQATELPPTEGSGASKTAPPGVNVIVVPSSSAPSPSQLPSLSPSPSPSPSLSLSPSPSPSLPQSLSLSPSQLQSLLPLLSPSLSLSPSPSPSLSLSPSPLPPQSLSPDNTSNMEAVQGSPGSTIPAEKPSQSNMEAVQGSPGSTIPAEKPSQEMLENNLNVQADQGLPSENKILPQILV